ncbi:MAG: hypothetical protein AAB368_16145, partial [bacterium]
MELSAPGDEEATGDEEAPAAQPKPKPKPRPKPRPKPKPKPAPPASPYDYLPIEDFERFKAGEAPATLKRAGTDPKAQFAVQTTEPGRASARCLSLKGIPALADSTVWSLPRTLDLKGWRGVSLWAKAGQPLAELKVGVLGQGAVWHAAAVGPEWMEIRLDFAEDPGRGPFDPGAVTEIVVTAAHEQASPGDVQVDDVAAWRERVPSAPLRWGLNVAAPAGPYGWRLAWDEVNCAGRVARPLGLSLGFWSAPLPYQRWASGATWRELPHGLLGALRVALTARVEPAAPAVLMKVALREERGERFAAVRPAPVRESVVEIPLAEFAPDAVENLRVAPGDADGVLSPGDVREWSLEVIPATERQFRGTLYVREAWALGAASKPAPALKPRPRPRPKPKPAAKPKPAEPAEDEAPAEEGGGGDIEMAQ